jgi:hypothetical protein
MLVCRSSSSRGQEALIQRLPPLEPGPSVWPVSQSRLQVGAPVAVSRVSRRRGQYRLGSNSYYGPAQVGRARHSLETSKHSANPAPSAEPCRSQCLDRYETPPGLIEILLSLVLSRACLVPGSPPWVECPHTQTGLPNLYETRCFGPKLSSCTTGSCKRRSGDAFGGLFLVE